MPPRHGRTLTAGVSLRDWLPGDHIRDQNPAARDFDSKMVLSDHIRDQKLKGWAHGLCDPPIGAVRAVVTLAVSEDLTPLGDLTSALLPAGASADGRIVARTAGVIAGRACVDETFRQVDTTIECVWQVAEGASFDAGAVLGNVAGPLASVLTAERTALNFLGHLSGIATLTRAFVNAAGPRLRVWDTRKTTPGLRALEKAAVRAGGGANHRGNLSDWVMFKDNHLSALGIDEAVRRRARDMARPLGACRSRSHRTGRGGAERRRRRVAARQHDA